MRPDTRRELEALREIATATAASSGPEEVLRVLGERARALFAADHAAAVAGEAGEELPPELRCVLEGAAPVGTVALPELPGATGGEGELRSALAVPLRLEEETYGLLVLGWRRPHPLPEGTVVLAETVAAQGAVALHNARRCADLQRSTQARDRFFSAMSHDLRTPIAAIVGYSELLSDGIVGELTEKQHEMVERISQVAAHLSDLVDGILDLAKLDAGRVQLQPEPVVLRQLLQEAALAVEPQAEQKGLRLKLELDGAHEEVVKVDPVRVKQVVVNLLSNAVKFTEQGEVAVTAGVDDSQTWVTVRDTGPGLPQGSEEAVFEEFVQVASGEGEKREPGSGLGLAVSRRLARAMGGELVAESTPGEGSAFTLVLPVGRS